VDDLHELHALLADDQSRALLERLIRYRLAGHSHVRIAPGKATLEEAVAILTERVGAGSPSTLAVSGAIGNLVHYDFEWDGLHYVVDTLPISIAQLLVNEQYYFDRGGVRIAPEPGDVVIDGGCCTGETVAVFAQTVGPRGHVYGFEPLASHVEICQYNFSSAQNISIAPFGLADHTLYAPPVASATYSPGFRADWTTDPVPMTTLDEYVTSHKIERIDFFKLDIEGSELAALRGARGTLLRDRPKLALSVYHKPNDYFEIAKFVTELGCGYRLFLEHHTIYGEETVLYATA
jgi:FkbM family methyltransferase